MVSSSVHTSIEIIFEREKNLSEVEIKENTFI